MSLDEHFDEDDALRETTAILNCLEYLRREAISSGLEEAARYIAMAANSVHRTIIDEGGHEPGGGTYFPGGAQSGLH